MRQDLQRCGGKVAVEHLVVENTQRNKTQVHTHFQLPTMILVFPTPSLHFVAAESRRHPSQRRAGEGVGAGISKESMEGEAGGQDAYQAAQALESVTDLVSKRREPVGGVGGPGPPWSFSRAKAAGASLHNGR